MDLQGFVFVACVVYAAIEFDLPFDFRAIVQEMREQLLGHIQLPIAHCNQHGGIKQVLPGLVDVNDFAGGRGEDNRLAEPVDQRMADQRAPGIDEMVDADAGGASAG